MGQMPNYYRKNAAQGAARRVLAGKKANPEQMRDVVGQVVTWCYLIAVRGVTEWNAAEMDKLLDNANKNAQDYMIRVRTVGAKSARKWLDGVADGLTFVLPADKPQKTKAARDELAQKRMGAEMAWEILTAALIRKAPWGCGVDKKTAQRVLNETASVYKRFLDWAVEGDAYGMERLKRDVESVLGEAVEVVDDHCGAVFSDRLY